MIKKPMHRKYNKLCYYCICQFCNMLHCPFSLRRSRFDVCSRCLSRKNPRPRLECDFFQHFRKTDIYYIRAKGVPPPAVRNKVYCVVVRDGYYGPFYYDKALEVRKRYGGSIHVLNITDTIEPWKEK